MVLVGEGIMGEWEVCGCAIRSTSRPVCTHRRVFTPVKLGPLNVQKFMKISFKVIFLAFMLSGRPVLFVNISLLSSPGLISSHVYCSFNLPSAGVCPVPVRLLTMIYIGAVISAHKSWWWSINSLRCGAECLKYHTASWRWGIYKGADYCTTISCASEFSDLSCFLRHWATALLWAIPTPPHVLTGRSLAWILAALLSPRLNRSH